MQRLNESADDAGTGRINITKYPEKPIPAVADGPGSGPSDGPGGGPGDAPKDDPNAEHEIHAIFEKPADDTLARAHEFFTPTVDIPDGQLRDPAALAAWMAQEIDEYIANHSDYMMGSSFEDMLVDVFSYAAVRLNRPLQNADLSAMHFQYRDSTDPNSFDSYGSPDSGTTKGTASCFGETLVSYKTSPEGDGASGIVNHAALQRACVAFLALLAPKR